MMSETTRNVQPVTVNLGKEGSCELVPSRYAVRVGDVDVVLIRWHSAAADFHHVH